MVFFKNKSVRSSVQLYMSLVVEVLISYTCGFYMLLAADLFVHQLLQHACAVLAITCWSLRQQQQIGQLPVRDVTAIIALVGLLISYGTHATDC